jgi:hypothetical protein
MSHRAAALALGLLCACASQPEIRTQSAPDLNLARYATYDFMAKPGTDTSSYTSLTTRFLKESVGREMQARGYTRSDQPDLLINFNVLTADKVEGTSGPGVGYGWWRGYYGYGWGAGYADWSDIHTYTEGTLTIDVVDRARNELVWSGSAVGRLTSEVLAKPQPAIDDAVSRIFARYPKPPVATR